MPGSDRQRLGERTNLTGAKTFGGGESTGHRFICILAAVGALLVAPQAAQARAGTLDRGFGHGGKVVTKTDLGPGWYAGSVRIAQEPDGSLIVLAGPAEGKKKLVRYLPDGRIDKNFGSSGSSKVEVPGFALSVSDLAVDSKGRTVVFGTANDRTIVAPSPGAAFEPLFRQLAVILRYDQIGNLDPTFGGGDGILTTDFGLPPQAGSPGQGNATETAAAGGAGTVDSEDRPILVGGVPERFGFCEGRGSRYEVVDKLIARFTPTGELDASFGGGDGIAPLEGVQRVSDIARGDRGVLTLATAPQEPCPKGRDFTVIRLHRDGAPDLSFGEDGTRRYRLGEPGHLLLDRLGQMYVEAAGGVVRLTTDGNIDRAFGTRGVATLDLPGGQSGVALTAVDARGRTLLTGTLTFRPEHRGPTGERLRRRYVIARLDPTGTPDRGFGDRGVVVTGFGRFSNASARDGLIDSEGQLVVAGVTNRIDLEPSGGLALARYRLGK